MSQPYIQGVLTPEFRFSQHSLADFEDCPRRFYLRHVARQAWPLLETGPHGMDALTYHDYLRRGATLHRWIERYWLGLPPSAAGSRPTFDDPGDRELAVWWARFQATDFSGLPERRLPELELSAPLGEFRLYARFDLLAIGAGAGSTGDVDQDKRLVIVDWKTLRGETPPSPQFLKQRMQTRAYLYVLTTAGAPFNDGAPIAPEQCAMRYWLANFPERPWVEITYSRGDYEADREHLIGLASDAARRTGGEAFELTSDERHCTYCTYRTLCHRRGEPVSIGLLDDDVVQIMPSSDAESLDY
jgi:hypothetical protein